jgi:hypothetical protein
VPYQDPEKKIESMRRWRKSSTAEYHKWLYDRRKLRFDKAEAYEDLVRIAATGANVKEQARKLLDRFEAEEERLGRFFDHVANRGSNVRMTMQSARDTHPDV